MCFPVTKKCLICTGIPMAVMFVVACVILGWMGYTVYSYSFHQEHNTNTQHISIVQIAEYDSNVNAKQAALVRSWQQEPFADVMVIKATDTSSGNRQRCPESHPDDLIFDVWPGTTHMCDCLEREHNRIYQLDIVCEKPRWFDNEYQHRQHRSTDCRDVAPIAPIVQNQLNGSRYCARRTKGLALEKAVRPLKNTDSKNATFVCPQGYKACQEDWLKEEQSAQYTYCIPEKSDTKEECPITSLAFSLKGLSDSESKKYQKASQGSDSDGVLYYSKSVKQMPVDQVKFSSQIPCWDHNEVHAGTSQGYYFPEFRRKTPKCKNTNASYQEMPLADDKKMTEYEFQKENKVLEVMESAQHYSYSFFPDSSAKKQVNLSVFQKSVYQFSLDCQANPKQNITMAMQTLDRDPKSDPYWQKMAGSFQDVCSYGFLVLIFGCLGLCYGVGASLTIMAALFLKPLIYAMYTIDSIEKGGIQIEVPDWLNQCLNETSRVLHEDPSSAVKHQQGMLLGLSALLWAYIAMVTVGLVIFTVAMLCVLFKENDNNQNRGYRLLGQSD